MYIPGICTSFPRYKTKPPKTLRDITRALRPASINTGDGSPKGRVILSFVVDSTTHKPVKVFTTCRHNG